MKFKLILNTYESENFLFIVCMGLIRMEILWNDIAEFWGNKLTSSSVCLLYF